MQDLTGSGLAQKLFSEITGKANCVLFLHPQLALCSLVHSVDEEEMNFGYTHVPSMGNLTQLAAHSFGRTGSPQTIAISGEWSPALIQAIVACLRDTLTDGTVLRWSDPAADPIRVQSTLYLLLLFSTLCGKYSMLGLSINLRHSVSQRKTRASASTLWLYPGALTSLRQAREIRFVFQIPIFQHAFAAPAGLVGKYLPGGFVTHYGIQPDPARWEELLDMLEGVGGGGVLSAAEGLLGTLCCVALLLDTCFREGKGRMLENVNALCGILRIQQIGDLFAGLRPHISRETCFIESTLPDSIYLDATRWCASLMDLESHEDDIPSLNIASDWPFTDPKFGASYRDQDTGGSSGELDSRTTSVFCNPQCYAPSQSAVSGGPPAVSIVCVPQTGEGVEFAGGGGGGGAELPECLAPHVFLANLASEHVNVWSAKTLLPEEEMAKCPGVRLVDSMMQRVQPQQQPHRQPPPSRCPTQLESVLSVETYLAGAGSSGGAVGGANAAITPPFAVSRSAKTLSVRHTQGGVVYPFKGAVERDIASNGIGGGGHHRQHHQGGGGGAAPRCVCPSLGPPRVAVEAFLVSLADFLAPLLAADALFALQVPLYVTARGGGARGAGAELYPPLLPRTESAIENSVFIRVAWQLFHLAQGEGGTQQQQQQPQQQQLQQRRRQAGPRQPPTTPAAAGTPRRQQQQHGGGSAAARPPLPSSPSSSSPSPRRVLQGGGGGGGGGGTPPPSHRLEKQRVASEIAQLQGVLRGLEEEEQDHHHHHHRTPSASGSTTPRRQQRGVPRAPPTPPAEAAAAAAQQQHQQTPTDAHPPWDSSSSPAVPLGGREGSTPPLSRQGLRRSVSQQRQQQQQQLPKSSRGGSSQRSGSSGGYAGSSAGQQRHHHSHPTGGGTPPRGGGGVVVSDPRRRRGGVGTAGEAIQIVQLQQELERMDRMEGDEPPQTVSVHSTPERRGGGGEGRRQQRVGGGGGAALANPLQGSMAEMVRLTKSFRLRQEQQQQRHTKPQAKPRRSASPSSGKRRPLSELHRGGQQQQQQGIPGSCVAPASGPAAGVEGIAVSRGFSATPVGEYGAGGGRSRSRVASGSGGGGGGGGGGQDVAPSHPQQGFTEASWKDLLSAFA